MNTPPENTVNSYFLSGGGEMGQFIRDYDWAANPLGTPSQWPLSMRSVLAVVLQSAFPMVLFWGKDLICLHNNAYTPTLGQDREPAIGKKASDIFPEAWEYIGPILRGVMTTGEAVGFEDQLIPVFRNGQIEDVYWTYSYSPAYDDDGTIGGVFVVCSETTGAVQAVKNLKESEKRFTSLIKEAAIGIVTLIGEDNIIEIANDAYGKLLGRNHDELIGYPLFDIIPETKPYFGEIINNVRISGKPHYLNNQPYFVFVNGIRKDGYLNLIYQLYKKEEDIIDGVMILCQDVTEQIVVKQQIEDNEMRLRSFVESAPFPIGVYVGREMRIELANQTILDVWGKGNDVVGKTYHEILPEVSPAIYRQLDDVYTTGIPYHARDQRVDLFIDGKLQPYYFNYSFTPLFDAEGQVYGVMNTAAEITDLAMARLKLEQSERNFRNIILQTPVAMCLLTGPDHVIEVANDTMIELWGKERNQVMDKPVFIALPDAREQGLEALMAHVYQTGETFSANEMPVELVRHGNLETVYQNFVYDAYRDSDGTILGVLAISIDVSAQVLARQKIEDIVNKRTAELEQANKNLEKSNAELAQFAYIASHDLQEPLRKISTFVQMIENKDSNTLDEQSKRYFDKIKNASGRMQTLIRDVLTYSELVKETENFTMVDLNQITKEIIGDYELLIEQKGARINYDGLPSIEAIPLQMSQLFGNLISNALKFARTDIQPEIIITAGELSAEEKRDAGFDISQDYYNIQVRDNGIGFKEEYADKIFSIFQRLHGKSEYEGTGIGLAMCKKIALNHRGDLNAHGSSENGAVFNALLPVRHI